MSDLPGGFSCAFFIGRTLEMLCFNANQVYLHFGNRTYISVDVAYSVSHSNPKPQRIHVPDVSNDLFKLIEHSVTSAVGSADGTLSLMFDHGWLFCCYGDEDVENFTILHEGRETYF